MADIRCVECGKPCRVEVNENVVRTSGGRAPDIIQAVLVCSKCGQRTVFEMTDNSVTFAPGKLFEVDLDTRVTAPVKDYFEEAVLWGGLIKAP